MQARAPGSRRFGERLAEGLGLSAPWGAATLRAARATMLDSLLTRPGSTPAALLVALARRLGAAGLAADVLTHAALGCGVGAGARFWLDHGWRALLALAVSGLLDAVDGRVARLGPGPTPWGGVIDLTFDRVVEASVLLGIAVTRPPLLLLELVIASTWYVNLCVFFAVVLAS